VNAPIVAAGLIYSEPRKAYGGGRGAEDPDEGADSGAAGPSLTKVKERRPRLRPVAMLK